MSEKNSKAMTKQNLIAISESLGEMIYRSEQDPSVESDEKIKEMVDAKEKVDSMLKKLGIVVNEIKPTEQGPVFGDMFTGVGINYGTNFDNRSKSLPGYTELN